MNHRSILQGIHASLHSANVSLEAAPDGQTKAEKEIVIYGQIVDFKELEKAIRKEKQEQWEIRVKPGDNLYGGCIRIRRSEAVESDPRYNGGETYVLTTKTYKPDKGNLEETEVELGAEVGANMLEEFKKLSSGGMIKTRYFFKVEDADPDADLVWEVDVYCDEKNEPKTWCKIDLEVPDLRIKRPKLPIELKNVREIPAKNRSEDDQRFLDRLMDREFVTPNPYTNTTA